jgi:beta-mannanase
MNLGVYDPRGLFRAATNLTYEHVFINWGRYVPGTAYHAVVGASGRGRTLLLTIFPFTDPKKASSTSTLLSDVVSGIYDDTISAIASDLASARASILLRWGPGMELEANLGRYDWATTNPNSYIVAYKYVVSLFKTLLPASFPATYIWSPDGQPNASNYYPGRELVDLIGLVAYSYAPYDNFLYGSPQDFVTIMNAKFNAAFLSDPARDVLLCELGAAGNPGDFAYKNTWIANALANASIYLSANSALIGLVYYADSSMYAYGQFGNPNFICSPGVWTY